MTHVSDAYRPALMADAARPCASAAAYRAIVSGSWQKQAGATTKRHFTGHMNQPARHLEVRST